MLCDLKGGFVMQVIGYLGVLLWADCRMFWSIFTI